MLTPWKESYDQPAAAKLLQSCPTLCDPIDGSPPGPAVRGILQARTLEWGAIAFSGKKPNPSQMSKDALLIFLQGYQMR